jgi:hypothetical protein
VAVSICKFIKTTLVGFLAHEMLYTIVNKETGIVKKARIRHLLCKGQGGDGEKEEVSRRIALNLG